MSLLPVADCLVIEHRICRCGCEHLCPAPVVHRLLASPAGEPRKLVLRPRHADEFPLQLQTTHTVRIAIPFCPVCFEPNIAWSDASQLVPQRPLADTVAGLFNMDALDAEIRKSLVKAGFRLEAAPRRAGAKDTRTDYEKALDL